MAIVESAPIQWETLCNSMYEECGGTDHGTLAIVYCPNICALINLHRLSDNISNSLYPNEVANITRMAVLTCFFRVIVQCLL